MTEQKKVRVQVLRQVTLHPGNKPDTFVIEMKAEDGSAFFALDRAMLKQLGEHLIRLAETSRNDDRQPTEQ